MSLIMLNLKLIFVVVVASVSTSNAQQTSEDLSTTTVTEELPMMDSKFESMDAEITNCPVEQISFELVTGFVYSAPADMLDSQPGTLMLTDCIDMCRKNKSCMSVNYETGLCVLFASSADMHPGSLTSSQFPVFTLYVQKTCLKGSDKCRRSWSYERVMGLELQGFAKKTKRVTSRQECSQMCFDEEEFSCRSASYNNVTGVCATSDMDRHAAVGTKSFKKAPNVEYLESNCVDDPVRLCEFQKMEGKILKTVDSVFQEVESLDECKVLCLQAPYRCHSFDYGDTGDKVCRLSHHAVATLTHIEEPHLDIPGASTYELSSCYNVTIDCRSGDMVARIKTSKSFNGKIYSKGSPNTCVNDVDNTLEFELVMAYNDIDCNVQRASASHYSSDIVVQHHDMIVTSADLGLSVHCKYDLSNKSVSNVVDLQVTGDIEPTLEEEQIVDSPNVIMRITDQAGDDIVSASVGDMLQLRFEIVDQYSPYEIFVRDLVALDGNNEKKITLLDASGCPTEIAIMRALLKVDNTGKNLGATFDAFKFPTSDKVQFRAVVTPCIPKCEPVICDVMDFGGQMAQTESYGRRKRSLDALSEYFEQSSMQDILFVDGNHVDIFAHAKTAGESQRRSGRSRREMEVPEQMLVEQTIKISDKFGFKGEKKSKAKNTSDNQNEEYVSEEDMIFTKDVSGVCINTTGLILACSIFLVVQVVLILVWTAIWHRRRNNKLGEPLTHTTTTESLRQLYDSGYPRRI
ncbi:UNVERIFIED_CONTAM: hypothetical protein RMT77_001572 [Armadillidium vulgare]